MDEKWILALYISMLLPMVLTAECTEKGTPAPISKQDRPSEDKS